MVFDVSLPKPSSPPTLSDRTMSAHGSSEATSSSAAE